MAPGTDPLGQIHPVGADFCDGMHPSGQLGIHPPVHRRGQGAKLLQVTAVDQQHPAKVRGLNGLAGSLAGGMEADIKVDGADRPARAASWARWRACSSEKHRGFSHSTCLPCSSRVTAIS